MAQYKNIDIVPDETVNRIHLSQGDVGRTLIFYLFENALSWSVPASSTIKCQGTKPSGFGFSVSCTYSGNAVTCVTTEEMTDEYGQIEAELVITSSDESQVFGTSNFILDIEKNPHPDGTVDGDAENPVIANLEAVITQAVDDWLDEHPEATTTVVDGSITEPKLASALALKTIKDYATPEMFGAVGDGVTDDTNAINDALSASDVVFGTRNYLVSTPITVGSDKYVVFTGKVTATTDAFTLNGYNTHLYVNEVSATNACIKIANSSSTAHCWVECNKLSGAYGLYYSGESWAQYNRFFLGNIECSVHGIHVVRPSTGSGWFNENYFHDFKCGGTATYGVYLDNESSNGGVLNGNKFVNCGFENSNDAIYIKGCKYTVFDNCRVQEIGAQKKVLTMVGANEYVEFHTPDSVQIKKFDLSGNTGNNSQIIAPLLFNDSSGMTYHAYVDQSVISYQLRRSRQLNVTSDITLNINSTTFAELPICDVFTFRDTTQKHTLTLSEQYGTRGITMIKVYVASGVSLYIKDSAGHTVVNKDNQTAGSYIYCSDGTGYWLGGRLA